MLPYAFIRTPSSAGIDAFVLTIDVDVENIPEEYRIKQPDAVNGDKLREYLKENGLEGQDGSLNCEWCHLEPQGESLRIR